MKKDALAGIARKKRNGKITPQASASKLKNTINVTIIFLFFYPKTSQEAD